MSYHYGPDHDEHRRKHGSAFDNEEEMTKDEDEYFENLPIDAKRTVQGIRGIEATQANLRKEFQKEVVALERKYAMKYQPLYDRRKRVIAGQIGVSFEEVMIGEEESQKDDEGYQKLPAFDIRCRIVPATPIEEFWLRALQTHPGISNMICNSDEAALKHLTDVTITYPNPSARSACIITNDIPLSFAINFYFSPNEFFTNLLLTKSYVYKDKLSFYGTFLYSHVIGDTVHWRPGKNLIELVERIKGYQESDEDHDDNSKDDDDGGKESFFKFFYPPPLITVPEGNLSSNQMHQDQGENREDEDREDMIDEEFDIGEALKERIVPHAVDYFTGDAFCYEDDDNYETDNEENSDEGEEDGDEDEEDD